MARNGSGTYVLPAGQPVVTNTTISSTTFNTLTSDLATALTTSVCTDGQTPMTAALNMGTHKINNVVDGTLSTDAATKSQVDASTSAASAALSSAVSTLNASLATSKESIMGRNYLHNGGMRIAQRATTYALTTSVAYGSMDRWFTYTNSTAAHTFNQVANTGGLRPYLARLGRNNGSSVTGGIFAGQVLETQDSIELAGNTVILSFMAKKGANFSSSGDTINVRLYTGTGTDQSATLMTTAAWTGSATPINASQVLTTTLTRYTFTAAIPDTVTQIGVQFLYVPTGTAGADDNFFFTEVQLEKSLNGGLVASTYEHVDYTDELNRCRRFYQAVNLSTASYTAAGSNILCGGPFPIKMRAAPTPAQIVNNYMFAAANVTTTTSTYFVDSSSLLAFRTATATGPCQFSEATGVSADFL